MDVMKSGLEVQRLIAEANQQTITDDAVKQIHQANKRLVNKPDNVSRTLEQKLADQEARRQMMCFSPEAA